MPTRIKETLSSLIMSGHDVWTARDAALSLLSELGYVSKRTGPTYRSFASFLRDFPIASAPRRDAAELSLLDAFSYVAILFQWTMEDMSQIVGWSDKSEKSILFLLVSVKHDLNIRGKRCEKWIRKIRRAFGSRKDMSIVVMFVQGNNLVFSFAYHNGHTWQVTACPAVSCAENTEFMAALSLNSFIGKSRLNSLDDVRQLWINAIQEEYEERKGRELRTFNARLYSILRDVLDHGLTYPGQLSEVADILLESGCVLRELSSKGLEYPTQLSDIADILMDVDLTWEDVSHGEVEQGLFEIPDALIESVDSYGKAGIDRIVAAMDRVLNKLGISAPRFPELLWGKGELWKFSLPPNDVDEFLTLVREEMDDDSWDV